MQYPLYTIYTPGHQCLFDEFLAPSAKEFELRPLEIEGNTGALGTDAYHAALRRKASYMLQAVQENMGGYAYWADTDIVIFRDIAEEMIEIMAHRSVAMCPSIRCRARTAHRHLNTGLWVAKCNEHTEALFKQTVATDERHWHVAGDQSALNWAAGVLKMKASVLPKTYWHYGLEKDLNNPKLPPENLRLYHACYVTDTESKAAALRKVSAIVKARR